MDRKKKAVMKLLVITFLLFLSQNLLSKPGKIEDIKQDYRSELMVMWDKVYNLGEELTEQEYNRMESIEIYANENIDMDLFYDLAVVYMNVPKYEEANLYMMKAAMLRHPYATHNMGYWYEFGFGNIKVDKEISVKSYKHAFNELNLARSGNRLSDLYLFDKDFKNYEEANKILIKITENPYFDLIIEEQDIMYAEHNLGLIYRYAMGVDADIDKSIEYFKSAHNKGNTESGVNIAQLLRGKYRETKNKNFNIEAKKYYMEASEKGNSEAMFFLGYMKMEEGYENKNEELIISGLGWMYLSNEIGLETDHLISLYQKYMEPISEARKKNLKYLSNICKRKSFKNCFSENFDLVGKYKQQVTIIMNDYWSTSVMGVRNKSSAKWNLATSINKKYSELNKSKKKINLKQTIEKVNIISSAKDVESCNKKRIYISMDIEDKENKFKNIKHKKVKINFMQKTYEGRVGAVSNDNQKSIISINFGFFDTLELKNYFQNESNFIIEIIEEQKELFSSIKASFPLNQFNRSLDKAQKECYRIVKERLVIIDKIFAESY